MVKSSFLMAESPCLILKNHQVPFQQAQRDVNSLTQGDELREVLLALFLATGTWLGVW